MKNFKEIEKLKDNCLKASTCNDETRIMLLDSVNHNSKLNALISTNGYTMTVLKSRYDDELKDKSINVKTFKTNTREFPRITSMFEISDQKFKHTVKVNFEKCFYLKSKRSEKPKHLHINNDGSLSFELTDKRLITINAEFIKPLIGHELIVNIIGDLKPIYINLNDSDYFIIMPLKI